MHLGGIVDHIKGNMFQSSEIKLFQSILCTLQTSFVIFNQFCSLCWSVSGKKPISDFMHIMLMQERLRVAFVKIYWHIDQTLVMTSAAFPQNNDKGCENNRTYVMIWNFPQMPMCESSHLLVSLIFGQLCIWLFANANVKSLSVSHTSQQWTTPFRLMFVLNVILLYQMVPGNP